MIYMNSMLCVSDNNKLHTEHFISEFMDCCSWKAKGSLEKNESQYHVIETTEWLQQHHNSQPWAMILTVLSAAVGGDTSIDVNSVAENDHRPWCQIPVNNHLVKRILI